MNIIRIFVSVIFCCLFFDYGQCFVIETMVLVGAGTLVAQWGYEARCHLIECCTDHYIPANLTSLRNTLKAEFYGQYVAVETVLDALEDHIGAEKKKKALAVSFHGSSGTGKNHLVNFIVDALYKNGAKSNYVHIYNGYLDFSSKKNVAEFERQIKKDITRHLKSCPRSIFIFDEVDHMPEGMLDALLHFLDYNPRILDVDPTQAIFIFVSNTGSAEIEKLSIQMWQDGKKREEAKLSNFESHLVHSAFHGQGGFHKSDLIEMDFIDHYIPFLPFERAHVIKCIDTAFRRRGFSEQAPKMIEKVLSQLTFEPPPHNLYSKTGCKIVDPKVAAIIEAVYHSNSKKTKS